MLIFEKNSIFNFSNPTFYNLILPYKTQILTYLARRFNKRDRTLLYVHIHVYMCGTYIHTPGTWTCTLQVLVPGSCN